LDKDAKRARINLAKKIANQYLPNGNIDSIAISGSTARGGVDSWSDIEIVIFWKAQPSTEDRLKPINEIKGQLTRQITPSTARFFGVENFTIGPVAIDIVHNITPIFLKLLNDTIESTDVDRKKQEILAISSSLYSLHGEELIKLIKIKTFTYALEYQKCVLMNVKLPNIEILKIHASRKDFIPFYKNLSNGIVNILDALCAVNKRYFTGEKRVAWLTEDLEIKPDNLHSRIEQIFRSGYSEGIKEIELLTTEVVEIILSNTELKGYDLDSGWKCSRRKKLAPEEIDKIFI
jgi:predicted nucleotidyltransferase